MNDPNNLNAIIAASLSGSTGKTYMPDSAVVIEVTQAIERYRPGIGVVPDPLPEPHGSALVVDADGDAWRSDSSGRWTLLRNPSGRQMSWGDLLDSYGPVTIYRPQAGSPDDNEARASAWSDYRSEYGAGEAAAKDFFAGWDAARGTLDIGGAQR